jgi:hypothetical protein
MRKVLVAVSLLATLASVALVAQVRYLSDASGTWKPWQFYAYPDNRRLLGARPAEVNALEAQLLRLNAIIKKTDGFTAPIGFSVETVGNLDPLALRPSPGTGEPAITVRPLPASLNFGAYGIHEIGSGATVKRFDTGETSQLLFFVNQLSLLLSSDADSMVPEFEKLETDVARLSAPRPDLFGMPRYGDTLVLKKSAEPIWTAVPFAETLELLARAIDRRLADNRDALGRLQSQYNDLKDPKKRDQRIAEYKAMAALSKDPAYMDKMMKADAGMEKAADTLLPPIADARAVVTATEQELASVRTMVAALSTEDKAAAACYAVGDTVSLSRFRRVPAAGCEPLVRPNWKLFNPALPRSAPQLLTIAHFDGCLREGQTFLHVGGCTANKRLLESIDKAALLAWLQ